MSHISIDDVKKLATLSALSLTEEEIKVLLPQLDEIIGFVEQLQEVDTLGVEPTYQVTDLRNVWRDDELIDYNLSRDELLNNTHSKQDGQIKVKRVLI